MVLGTCTMLYPTTCYVTSEQCQCELMRNVLATLSLRGLAAVFNRDISHRDYKILSVLFHLYLHFVLFDSRMLFCHITSSIGTQICLKLELLSFGV